uniref:Uncharacterized protein n=1 Tax=Anopheles coluzzii TaxID=1518534 RepID=A0A8W7P834_ANOCL
MVCIMPPCCGGDRIAILAELVTIIVMIICGCATHYGQSVDSRTRDGRDEDVIATACSLLLLLLQPRRPMGRTHEAGRRWRWETRTPSQVKEGESGSHNRNDGSVVVIAIPSQRVYEPLVRKWRKETANTTSNSSSK